MKFYRTNLIIIYKLIYKIAQNNCIYKFMKLNELGILFSNIFEFLKFNKILLNYFFLFLFIIANIGIYKNSMR